MSRQEVKAIIGDPPSYESDISVQWEDPDGTSLVASMLEEKLFAIVISDERGQTLKIKRGPRGWD